MVWKQYVPSPLAAAKANVPLALVAPAAFVEVGPAVQVPPVPNFHHNVTPLALRPLVASLAVHGIAIDDTLIGPAGGVADDVGATLS